MHDQHRQTCWSVWRRKTHVSRHLPDWLELVCIIPTVNSILPPFLSWHTRIDIRMETRGEFRIFPFDFLKIIFGPICRNCRLLGRCTRWCYVYIGILRDSESSRSSSTNGGILPFHDRHNERHFHARSYFIFQGINGVAVNSFPRAGWIRV